MEIIENKNITLYNVTCLNGNFLSDFFWNTENTNIDISTICTSPVSPGGGVGILKPGTNITFCNLEVNYTLFKVDFSLSKTFFEKVIESPDCKKIEFWKWFVKIDRVGNNYFYVGIRWWYVIFTLAIIFIILVLYVISRNDEVMDKLTEFKKKFKKWEN